MRKRSSAPVNIGAALAGALKSLNQINVLNFTKIADKWPNIVGPQLSAVSQPANLKRKVLTLWVSEPVWVDTMLYMKREIISKINAIFSGVVVDSIRILHKSGINPVENQPDQREKEFEAALPESAIREVESALDNIPDSQLRSAFKRVMLKDIKLKSKRSQPE